MKSPEQQRLTQEAWARVEAHVTTLATSGRKKAAVYEVHHAIEHARKFFLDQLARGFTTDHIEREVMKAYEQS